MTNGNRKTSLRGLRTFCTAAELGSFRAAAERLFITASAVSHQIKALEEEFGNRLFDRSGRAIRLTASGLALYEDVSPLIAQLDLAASRHRKVKQRSTLRISVQPFFASELFIPRLNEFTRQHPDINITVDTSDESVEKHPVTSDVSIRVFRSAPSGFASDRLFALQLVPAASAEFRDSLRFKGNRIIGDFPVIVHESRPNAWLEWQKASGIELPKETASVHLDSMIAVARAAERGVGAALVPLQLSDKWFESGSLVPLFPTQLTTRDAYYLVRRSESDTDDNVRLLRDWVLSQFKDIEGRVNPTRLLQDCVSHA